MPNRDNLGTTGNAGMSNHESGWEKEDTYWQSRYSSRPYASADRSYEHYRPGYRYGFESANRYRGRQWSDVESDLRSGWDSYEHRGGHASTWDEIKHSVRDAWDRVTGQAPEQGTSRTR